MTRLLTLILVLVWLPSTVMAEGVLTPQANPPDRVLYDYRSKLRLQDDFLGHNIGTLGVGALGWATATNTIVAQAGEANRPGIIRNSTGGSSGTVASMFLSNTAATYLPSVTRDMTWILRLTQNDANTAVHIGEGLAVTVAQPTDGIYFEKLDADTNWFCNVRNGGTESRADSGVTVASTTSVFTKFFYTSTGTTVSFFINGAQVCAALAMTNYPTLGMNPFLTIKNSAAVAKTIDVDYFELNITSGITR